MVKGGGRVNPQVSTEVTRTQGLKFAADQDPNTLSLDEYKFVD